MTEAKTLTRKFHYRRLFVNDSTLIPISEILIQIHKEYEKNALKRSINYNDTLVIGSSFRVQENEKTFFLHLTVTKPDSDTSVIPTTKEDATIQTETLSPPEGKDFLKGDVFLLVKNHHVIFVANNASEGIILEYISTFLRKYGYLQPDETIRLEKSMNIDKFKMIQDEGIKGLHFKNRIPYAVSEYYNRKAETGKKKNVFTAFIGKISQEVKEMLSDEIEDIDNLENITLKVELSFDRRKLQTETIKERFQKVGEDLFQNDDFDSSFTILTNKNVPIRTDELNISQSYPVIEKGNSFEEWDTWLQLDKYYYELKESDALIS